MPKHNVKMSVNKSVKPLKWKKLTDAGDMIAWQEGETRTFEEYSGFTPPVKAGTSGVHAFKENGKTLTCYGSTILDKHLKDFPVGTPVRITYLGKKKGLRGQEYKAYDIFGPDEAA